jgi:hypothetical protein
VSIVLCFFASASGGDTSATQPQVETGQNDAEAIIAIVQKARDTPVKSKKEQDEREKRCEEQLAPYKDRWDAMYLAAVKLGFDRNNRLLPMLAAPGKSVIPKFIQLLTWDGEADFNVAVQVTTLTGTGAIPVLLEQYRNPPTFRVRSYIVLSVRDILQAAKQTKNMPVFPELLPWATALASDKDEAYVIDGLRVLGYLFDDTNAKTLEPIFQSKLKDERPKVRIVALDQLMKVRPDADYVRAYVLNGALKSQDASERIADIQRCARLSVNDDTLDVLFQCAFDKDKIIRTMTAQTLTSLGPKTAPLADRMLKKLQDGEIDSLASILTVVRQSEKDRAAAEQMLIKSFDDGNTNARRVALNFLTSSTSLQDDTLRKVTHQLDDADKGIRILALRVLYPFRQKPFVHEAVKDRVSREKDALVNVLLNSFLKEESATQAAPNSH